MNEAETRAELIDPKLREAGWGIIENSRVLRERDVCKITEGRIRIGGRRDKALYADYILVYKGIKLAVIEAKSDELSVGEGVAQAKLYAQKLQVDYAYSTNGKEIYQICMKTGEEKFVDKFPAPDELWNLVYSDYNEWREKFASIPFETKGGIWRPRYYQEIAINRVMEAIAQDKKRILLTLATGTGKTSIAFQISWKLYHTRWNLQKDGRRRPRILFLADRNILADQAFNEFSAFPDDAMVRIEPDEIRKKGKVPKNGSIFFTIYQTFMSGKDNEGNPQPYFGDYPEDFFDFIIIDECHRGGANDESTWRMILEYFSPAVQLGLTATPKRDANVDTYRYFGNPVYIYSLKEGIEDGFLTPFKVKRIKTTLDDYVYTGEDYVLEGEVEEGRLYTEVDFNRIIEIREREEKRVEIFMSDIDPHEKTIVFCRTQGHAALIRDIINQHKPQGITDPNYCVRVTANDGEIGEQFLRLFRDNDRTIPTILTTSKKLSTGVDARNVRNIVLLRPVNSIVEFKQIVGRGTRLFEGKEFFTIYDFVDAYKHFFDPEWDGEPIESVKYGGGGYNVKEYKKDKVEENREEEPKKRKEKVKIKLRNGKEIKDIVNTSFWENGKPISVQEFMENLFGELPKLFKSEEELRRIWSNPMTRKALLEKLDKAGYGQEELKELQKLIDAESSDLFDVLEYLFNSDVKIITRKERVERAKKLIFEMLNEKEREFVEFVLNKYIEVGIEELDQENLPILLESKYESIDDAVNILGDIEHIKTIFVQFQEQLYAAR